MTSQRSPQQTDDREFSIAALVSHPIQYQAPLFREFDSYDCISLTIYFCSKRGIEPTTDPGFEEEIVWDQPLLEGYEYKFLKNWRDGSGDDIVGQVNPDVCRTLVRGDHDALWVHGYASMTNWLAVGTAILTNLPVVFRGESTLLNQPHLHLRLAKRVILHLLFGRIDAFAAIGTLNREFYRSYGIPEGQIFHAPYSVDNEFFRTKRSQLPPVEILRQEAGVPVDRPVVLFVGKLVERKRPSNLFQAFRLATSPEEATLVYVGDGPKRDSLEELVKRQDRSGDVVFAGFQNQSKLPKYYEIADVFVLPSVEENWGLVVNEAMNFGLPIVATDTVGASVDLVDEENGRVIPADNVDILAGALQEVLEDDERRTQMGKVSERRVQEWGIEETAEGILNAVKFAIHQHK